MTNNDFTTEEINELNNVVSNYNNDHYYIRLYPYDDNNRTYYEWKKLFPRYFIKIDKTIDFNKPVDLWIQFDHMKKFDVTNLSKTFIDMITRVYSDYWKMPIDDNKIQLRNCSTHDYVDSYKESAIFYVLKQKID